MRDRTKDGDLVDAICSAGHEKGTVTREGDSHVLVRGRGD